MNVNNNQNDDPRHHGADNADNGLGSEWCLYAAGTANSASVGAAAFDTNHEADEEEENERLLQQKEEEEQRAAIAAATARRKHRSLRERQKLASILDGTNYHRLPLRQRDRINELVDDFHSDLGDEFHDISTTIAAHKVDEEEENERVLQREEDEEQAAAIAADNVRRKNRSLRERRKLASILDDTNYRRFPLRQRNKINELVDAFHSKLGDDIHAMCTDQRAGESYKGLDSEKDTEPEVETALRFYPNTLRKRKARQGIRVDTNLYPIQCLTEMYNLLDGIVCQNVKAVSFIHLFARLAIEFGTFDEQERGGLLIRDSINRTMLHRLVHTTQGHIHRADNLFHTEMVKLKRAGLFLKKDIMDFGLLSYMCSGVYWFSEQKAKFIIDWDQNSLMTGRLSDGKTPLHLVACHQSTKGFRFLLDQTMHHFGKETGIRMLCKTDNLNKTPLRIACKQFDCQDVMKIVKDTLVGYPNPPLNSASLMIHTATHQQKFNHLDCVYFLIRRQPDIVMGWRLPVTDKNTATDDADIDADNNDRHMLSNRSEDNRKRKREDASIQPTSL